MSKAIEQWGNLAALVSGLYTNNYDQIARSLVDVIIEPERSALIPYFDQIKAEALASGALGSGISGSGPSIYALSKGQDTAHKVKTAMENIYTPLAIPFDTYVSKINTQGIKILEQK